MVYAVCPECGGTIRHLSETSTFCLDCDWDNLVPLEDRIKFIAVDAEWYTKTQLRTFRLWKDADFENVPPDWIGCYSSRNHWGHTTYYFHRSTVESHEASVAFEARLSRARTRQRLIPQTENIHTLAWTLCVRGDELIRNGWTYEMIDELPPYRSHSWRKKRLFRLCDLSQVSKTFKIETETQEPPPVSLIDTNTLREEVLSNWEAIRSKLPMKLKYTLQENCVPEVYGMNTVFIPISVSVTTDADKKVVADVLKQEIGRDVKIVFAERIQGKNFV